MYQHIEGKLAEKTPTYVVVDCGGVGYYLKISLHTFSKIPDQEKCKLYTHLVVRDDALQLFGFKEKEERTMFEHLIEVSGIGANTAIVILSGMSPTEVQQAITEGDVDAFKQVKGVGPRTAQRVIVDLKDKMEKEEFVPQKGPSSHNTTKKEALSALTALGFDQQKARKAVDKAIKETGEDCSVEELVKTGLKHL